MFVYLQNSICLNIGNKINIMFKPKENNYTLKNLLADPLVLESISANIQNFNVEHPFNTIQIFQNINKIDDMKKVL